MELSAEQNAMLERLCRKHHLGWSDRGNEFWPYKRPLTALRELLLAVQERDAEICRKQRDSGWLDDSAQWLMANLLMQHIRAQRYEDLF